MTRRERPLKRRQATRDERQRLLIVTEGEKTEPTYLDGVRRFYRRPRNLWRIEHGGGHPQAIVNKTNELMTEARHHRDEYDEVWWVFDVEDPTPHPGLEEIVALASRNGYHCAISHPCFELWLVLHFRQQTASISTAAAERLVRDCGCGYLDKDFSFDQVWPHHRKAIQNASSLHQRQTTNNPRLLDRNPWTSVHELVQQLINLEESGR